MQRRVHMKKRCEEEDDAERDDAEQDDAVPTMQSDA
jgi:hypothetical protein